MFGTFILRKFCGLIMSMGAVFLSMMIVCFGYLFGCIRIMMSSDNPFFTIMLTFMVMHFGFAATVLMTTTAGR